MIVASPNLAEARKGEGGARWGTEFGLRPAAAGFFCFVAGSALWTCTCTAPS